MNDVFITYAHRGSSIKYPENTLLSFAKAIEEGANGIELDVQLTKDHHVVVFHDLSLQRILKRKGQISDYTLAQLHEFDAGIWKNPQFKGVKIPTLDQVLQRVAKRNLMLNIELKNFLAVKNGLELHVLELVKKHKMMDKVVISTFNPLTLKILQKKNSHIPYAFLYFGFLHEPWEYACEYGCAYIHPPLQEVTESFLDASRNNGLKIVPYQVNMMKDIKQMIEMGVDGIITPRPHLAHRLLYAETKNKKRTR